MNRTLIAFALLFLPSVALAQTSQCSSFNSNPTVADVRIANSNEHSSGSHVAETGNGSNGGSNIAGSCTYTNPSSGNTCQTSCNVTFNPNGQPIVGDTGALNVPGSHSIGTTTANSPSASGGGAVTCSATFGMTVTNTADTNPVVFQQTQPATLSCPAKTLPTPTPTAKCGGGGNEPPCCVGGRCVSPIIIDTEREGFHLTSAGAGVLFDIMGNGHSIQIAWTDSQYHNAFLALPAPDGLVHNGKELFGNFTPQPPSANPNGFIALAQYDRPENGGNGDGVIDERDEVFSRLRLWIDENHDGVCQPNELHRLAELGVYSLALGYFESARTDQFGNQFRYKARVNPGERRDPRDETPSDDPGRWAYDVFFVVKQP